MRIIALPIMRIGYTQYLDWYNFSYIIYEVIKIYCKQGDSERIIYNTSKP